jgi:hypothetical protein
VETREYAVYGYMLDNRVSNLTLIAVLCFFSAIGCTAAISLWCLILLLVPVGIAIYIKKSGYSKPLLIGSRYLILGDRIIYYRNVSRAFIDKDAQTLTVVCERGQPLVISAEKFPTNARKPDKIRINRTAKFEKVAGRIIDRLKEAAPDAIVT